MKTILKVFVFALVIIFHSCSPEDGVDGIDGANGTNGKDGVDGRDAENFGVGYFILSGDISDAEAGEKIKTEFGTNTRNIIIRNTTNLTTLDLPKAENLVSVDIENNQKLKNITLDNLEVAFETINIRDNEILESISFKNLKGSENFLIIDNNSLATIELPVLKEANRGFNVAGNDKLISFLVPELVSVDFENFSNLTFSNNASLKNISMPKLENIYRTRIDSNESLETMDFSKVVFFNDIDIRNNTVLKEINFPVLNLEELVDNAFGSRIDIISNASLSKISIPNLTAARSIDIVGGRIESIDLGKLTMLSSTFELNGDSLDINLNIKSLTSFRRFETGTTVFSTEWIESFLKQLIDAPVTLENASIQIQGNTNTTIDTYVTELNRFNFVNIY